MNYIELEDTRLAPYAARSAQSRGRRFPEEEHPFRTPFQRDRDRIIHCNAFRRLEYKTQVFVYHEGDHYRTRLTHTIEVAQISRTIARALGLNEDLSEAIALAHDLGHPPFGHSGEKVLDSLMEKHGGFEHNAHSLRIVEELEKRYPAFSGLNLTWEVREGIVKHSSEHDSPAMNDEYDRGASACLEAQIVDIADEIAYNNHDIDDGLSSEILDVAALNDVDLWRENYERVRRDSPDADAKVQKYQTIIRIINAQVTDLVENIRKTIEADGIKTLADIRSRKEPVARFSQQMGKLNRQLKKSLLENMYRNHRVERMAYKAERILRELFGGYLKTTKILPPGVYSLIEKSGRDKHRAICDHVAGMTDRYALDEYKKLFDPFEKV